MPHKLSDETQHLLKAVVEHFDTQIKVVTEGHTMLSQKIDTLASELREEITQQGDLLRTEMRAGDDRLRQEMKEQGELLRAEIRTGDTALREELGAFRTEVKAEFTDVRAMMKLSYAEIDARFQRLETTVSDLAARLERLERRSVS